jgi:hypothetical protein
VFTVFRNALSALSPDFSHMLLVSGDRESAFAGDLLAGGWIHSGSASSSSAAGGFVSFYRPGLNIVLVRIGWDKM